MHWTARDSNHLSPTFFTTALKVNGVQPSDWGVYPVGQFGRASYQIRSEAAQNQTQCRNEADAYLLKNLGLIHSISLTSLPAAWLSPGQAITVQFPLYDEDHLIDTVDIPLTEQEPVSIGTRSYTG